MKKAKNSRRKIIRLTIVLLLLFMVAVFAAVVFVAESKFLRLTPGGLGLRFSTKIYSEITVLESGSNYSDEEIFYHLKELNYKINPSDELAPGDFKFVPPIIYIHARSFNTPDVSIKHKKAVLKKEKNNQWFIFDENNHPLSSLLLEPALITELSGPDKVKRDPTSWEEFPRKLVDAVLAAEDKRFYKHFGIDGRAVARAAWVNLKSMKNSQGGSTITQQLAKNLFLTHERTLKRKVLEALLALYLDRRLSKEKILTLYLNHIYLGQDGFFSVAGMKRAAQFYFGKRLSEITLAESALLAGLIRSPLRYNPFQNRKRSIQRRNIILKIMLEQSFISSAEYKEAINESVKLVKNKLEAPQNSIGEYFVAEVIRRLLPRYNEDMIFRYGLKIYTTMDSWAQTKADQAILNSPHQTAIVLMDPNTGRIPALVGGKNYQESQFNRATQALRQPGSCFKPFVYGAALENGFTPASILEDEPRAFSDGKNNFWVPQNFDKVYRGKVRLRDALSLSINGATLDLAQKIGIGPILHFAQKMGFFSPMEKNLTTALGSSEVTLIELVAAYAPFANGGFRVSPQFVTSVADAQDVVLELNGIEKTQVLTPALAYLMTSLMETTVLSGTANSLKELGWTVISAGKTGTTSKGRDAWFVGYTPHYLCGVWVGEDFKETLNLSGAKNAIPIWAKLMIPLHAHLPKTMFPKPQDVVTSKIDPVTGFLARSGCPLTKDEIFIQGSVPTRYCDLHSGGMKGWIQKFFWKIKEKKFENE